MAHLHTLDGVVIAHIFQTPFDDVVIAHMHTLDGFVIAHIFQTPS